jgi:DNA-binding NarL/FixJ family response regulator
MYRVIIADDHAIVCTGIELILNHTLDFRLVEQVRNGDELLKKISVFDYDALIMDVLMPGRDSLDVLKAIKEIKPNIPVMVFSMNNDENLVVRMLMNGAGAFVSKESPSEDILKTLGQLVRGMKVVTERQREILEEYKETSEINGEEHKTILTDREYQVLHFIARGTKSAEIATSLSLSKNTISNHRNNLLKKLKLRNNSDLTRYAMQQGII